MGDLIRERTTDDKLRHVANLLRSLAADEPGVERDLFALAGALDTIAEIDIPRLESLRCGAEDEIKRLRELLYENGVVP